MKKHHRDINYQDRTRAVLDEPVLMKVENKWSGPREAELKSRKVVLINNFKHTKTTKSIATKQVAR